MHDIKNPFSWIVINIRKHEGQITSHNKVIVDILWYILSSPVKKHKWFKMKINRILPFLNICNNFTDIFFLNFNKDDVLFSFANSLEYLQQFYR